MAKRGDGKSKAKSKSPSLPKPPRDPSEFCKKMEAWAEACMTVLPTDDEDKIAWRKEFQDHWLFIRRSIYKSCLLDRLMYGGEKMRTKMCPVHKGKWSGCKPPEEITCGCAHGLCVTGWLKNETDPESHNSGILLVTIKDDKVTEIKR